MSPAAANYAALLAATGSVPVAYAPSGIWKVYEDRHDIDAARAMVHAAQDAGHTLTRAGWAILTGEAITTDGGAA